MRLGEVLVFRIIAVRSTSFLPIPTYKGETRQRPRTQCDMYPSMNLEPMTTRMTLLPLLTHKPSF